MGSEQFVATTTQHPYALLFQPFHRHLDERRLAYPGLAGNENDLTVSGQDALQNAIQDFERSGPSNPPTAAGIGYRD